MDATSHTPTILLAVGILCVFFGAFGGGFKIKEISIPKLNNASRAMGAILGLALIAWSQFGNIKMPDPEPKKEVAEEDTKPVDDQKSPIPDDLTVKIDKLKPLWENTEISNKDISAEYLKIKENAEFENLSLVYKSEVNNKIDSLNDSDSLMIELKKYLADELNTLNSKADYLNKFFSEEVQKLRLSQKVKEALEKDKANLLAEMENSAKIGSVNDFLTCKSIVNKNCSQSTSLFKTPKVWVWVKVQAPRNTEVTLKWVNLDSGDEVNSRTYTIQKSTGYRLSASKSLGKAGKYEVRLFNKKSLLIAKKRFNVS